ncbi:MAG TPA: c-type cytochrome [Steroidobacteraceae bacterium]|nr:c-type cytochrome [Steroidobacteraceae bacterium]
MKRLLRWIGIAVLSIAALAIVGLGIVYALSERILTRTYPLPAVAVRIPADPAELPEGRRLATVHGCLRGCHGKQGEGEVMFDQPLIGRIVAPNLTAAVRRYTDAQLVTIIRHGLRPDGRSVVVMPAQEFGILTDSDLGHILAFLKSLPPAAGPAPSISLGPVARLGFATGKFKTAAQLISSAVPPPEAAGDEAARGRYLARSTCSECHGADLRGDSNPDFTSPNLQVVAAYTPAAFTQLLRTGVPLGARTLPTMGMAARENLAHLTDAEIAALYTYLHGLAGGATAAAPGK